MAVSESLLVKLQRSLAPRSRTGFGVSRYPAPRVRGGSVGAGVSAAPATSVGLRSARRSLVASDFPVGQFLGRVSTNIGAGLTETGRTALIKGPVWIEEVSFWGDSAFGISGVVTRVRIGADTAVAANSSAEGEAVNGVDSQQNGFNPISTWQTIKVQRAFDLAFSCIKIYHTNGDVVDRDFYAFVSFRTQR